MRILGWCCLAAVVLLVPNVRALSQEKQRAVRLVSYADLKQAVLKERGKVLVVDFWGEF